MELETAPADRKPPFCGIASICAPIFAFFGATILLLTRGHPVGEMAFDANEILAVLSVFFGLIAGTLFGGIGIYREESYPWLPRIGLILNALPLVAAIII